MLSLLCIYWQSEITVYPSPLKCSFGMSKLTSPSGWISYCMKPQWISYGCRGGVSSIQHIKVLVVQDKTNKHTVH